MTSLTGDKYAFLKMQAPPSYVAGLGRGASGFTTRSDIGPAREGPSTEAIAAARERRGDDEEGDNEQYQDPENETGLFAGMVYEADDEEADKIYASVDSRMDERRRARREAREQKEADEFLKKNPKIQEKFSDLKRGLAAVSDVEWENLPEVGNLTGKRKRANRNEGRAFVVPDSVLVSSRDKNAMETSLDSRQMVNGGFETPANGTGTITDFAEIGKARDTLLSLKLDQFKDTVAGSSSTIDPKGYLTGLDSMQLKTAAEIGDTKRGRTLLQSLIKTNSKHAPGWIAAARLEEVAGKMIAARKLIAEGCENCPKSEEVWREAARLNTPENAKVILANAVQHLPQSVNIWLDAADLETDLQAKKRVLRKALEYIPNSVKLWRKTVSLEENPVDARVLLSRAVEVVPLSAELWLALARVETPLKARQVLNKARKAIPTSHEIWIAAGRLQEQEGNEDQVDALIATGVAQLKRNGVELPREEWLKEAEKCESNGSVITCQAIVKATIHLDVDEDSRMDTWIDDAQGAIGRDRIQTARAIYAYALKVYPQKQVLWRRAADLEKQYGTHESLLAILAQAVSYCPHAEILWLMAAKESWQAGDVSAARKILGDAFAANPESEQIWLAACKLEAENNQIGAARQLMARARAVAGTDRIWMKSAVFERQHGTTEDAIETVNEAISKFPKADKLYMIKGQILDGQGDVQGARETLEEKAGFAIKARAFMERARYSNPRNPELWLESVRVEERAGNAAQAKTMMAKGLQECPSSGLLLSESIWMEPRPARRTKSVDALKKSNNDPLVLVAVARLFWAERKIDKGRVWFERAVNADPDLGDSFGWWYKFEKQHGTPEQQEKVIMRAIMAEPHHSPVWQATAKDMANSGKDTKEILLLVADKLS